MLYRYCLTYLYIYVYNGRCSVISLTCLIVRKGIMIHKFKLVGMVVILDGASELFSLSPVTIARQFVTVIPSLGSIEGYQAFIDCRILPVWN